LRAQEIHFEPDSRSHATDFKALDGVHLAALTDSSRMKVIRELLDLRSPFRTGTQQWDIDPMKIANALGYEDWEKMMQSLFPDGDAPVFHTRAEAQKEGDAGRSEVREEGDISRSEAREDDDIAREQAILGFWDKMESGGVKLQDPNAFDSLKPHGFTAYASIPLPPENMRDFYRDNSSERTEYVVTLRESLVRRPYYGSEKFDKHTNNRIRFAIENVIQHSETEGLILLFRIDDKNSMAVVISTGSVMDFKEWKGDIVSSAGGFGSGLKSIERIQIANVSEVKGYMSSLSFLRKILSIRFRNASKYGTTSFRMWSGDYGYDFLGGEAIPMKTPSTGAVTLVDIPFPLVRSEARMDGTQGEPRIGTISVDWTIGFDQIDAADVVDAFVTAPEISVDEAKAAQDSQELFAAYEEPVGIIRRVDLETTREFIRRHQPIIRVGKWNYQMGENAIIISSTEQDKEVYSQDILLREHLENYLYGLFHGIVGRLSPRGLLTDKNLVAQMMAESKDHRVRFMESRIELLVEGSTHVWLDRADGQLYYYLDDSMEAYTATPSAMTRQGYLDALFAYAHSLQLRGFNDRLPDDAVKELPQGDEWLKDLRNITFRSEARDWGNPTFNQEDTPVISHDLIGMLFMLVTMEMAISHFGPDQDKVKQFVENRQDYVEVLGGMQDAIEPPELSEVSSVLKDIYDWLSEEKLLEMKTLVSKHLHDKREEILLEGLEGARIIRWYVADLLGMEDVEPQRVSLRQILKLILLSKRKIRKNVEIENQVGEIDIVINEVAIFRVLMNLLKNALDTMDAQEGKIILRARPAEDDDHFYIEVEDEGTGIPSGDIDRVFEPHFTTKGPGEGRGLGLAIVKDLVENQLGGTIRLQSEVDKGSTFTIRLPTNRSEARIAASDNIDLTSSLAQTSQRQRIDFAAKSTTNAVIFFDGSREYANAEKRAEELAVLASSRSKNRTIVVYNSNPIADGSAKRNEVRDLLKTFGPRNNIKFVWGDLKAAAAPYLDQGDIHRVVYSGSRSEARNAMTKMGIYANRLVFSVGKAAGAIGHLLDYLDALALDKAVEGVTEEDGYFVVSRQASQLWMKIMQSEFVTRLVSSSA